MSLQETQNKLLALNVNDYTEKKNGLTYLSWANAWQEVLKVYPDAKYDIKKDEKGVACFGNPELGYMVYTTVTIADSTKEMWLPVLDFRNKAIKNPDMFNVNTSIMRCLTKNLAMFGLGLYIYAGEDLPEQPDLSEEIKEELMKITTVEDVNNFYTTNKSKYERKSLIALCANRKKELS